MNENSTSDAQRLQIRHAGGHEHGILTERHLAEAGLGGGVFDPVLAMHRKVAARVLFDVDERVVPFFQGRDLKLELSDLRVEEGDHHVVDGLAVNIFGHETFVVKQGDDAGGVGFFGEGVEGLDVAFDVICGWGGFGVEGAERGDGHLRHAEFFSVGDAFVGRPYH